MGFFTRLRSSNKLGREVETYVLQITRCTTVCNFFVNKINISIEEEMTIAITAKLIAIGATSL
jgi:hypothetical protein